MRWSLGTAVFSGMLGVTLFGIFLTPVFFYVIEGLGETKTVPDPRGSVARLRPDRRSGRPCSRISDLEGWVSASQVGDGGGLCSA